jgi:signal transduction histidine kinase
MVNDFLQTSRLEHGKINSKKETFDISTVIENVLHQMKATAEKKNISLSYVPDSSLVKVSADENYTEQIITNLVGNAIKFTERGSIKISALEDTSFIKVSVHDSGIGISEQNKTLLFGKFQKVSENILARDVLQGSGLGLYICKMLAVNMGGDIWLEKSVVGEGSTFVFHVPKAS